MTMAFVDCNNLGYRAFHTTGSLTHGADLTGVAYGFINQLFTFFKHAPYGTEPVFCWDSKHSLRKKVYPDYKKRDEQTEEAKERRLELYSQFDAIREDILPSLGWRGRCWIRDGYEADDLMAWGSWKCKDKCIIVSGDEDLYQCLYNENPRREVFIFNPGKNEFYTEDQLRKDYKVTGDHWPIVKAIAGCKSDNVPGVKGVGEKTAIKFLHGNMKLSDKKRVAIEEFKRSSEYERNLKLVTLPFGNWDEHVETYTIPKVTLKKQDFLAVFEKYGMNSFIKRIDEISNLLGLI